MGRRSDPLVDARVVTAIRAEVGPHVALRADANRKWDVEQAVAFGQACRDAHLEVGTCCVLNTHRHMF